MFNFSFINLGCSKNLVDTQFVIGKIFENNNDKLNYIVEPFDKSVEFVFLNTCGFISSGRDEMFSFLNRLLIKDKKIYILGCALQYFQKLISEDSLLIKNNIESYKEWIMRNKFISNKKVFFLSWNDLKKISLEELKNGYRSSFFDDFEHYKGQRAYTNIDKGFEYIKIAEGCNNNCAFCIIPQIRGKQKSLHIEDIIEQSKSIIKNGGKELIFISQDTVRYGVDLYGKPSLIELLTEVDKIDGDFVYKVLYLYPDIMSKNMLERFLKLEKFLPYFDIPLQHIAKNVLKKMGRYNDIDKIFDYISFIRSNFENSYIRTNFIIGFPGETETDFIELNDLITKGLFDNISLFQYHDEPLSLAYKYVDKVRQKDIERRFLIAKNSFDLVFEIKNNYRLSKKQYGYINDIINDDLLEIRPIMHLPDVDKYDIINISSIIDFYGSKELGLAIGDIISY